MDVWRKIAFIWLIANAIIVAHGGTVRSFPRYDYGIFRIIFRVVFVRNDPKISILQKAKIMNNLSKLRLEGVLQDQLVS